MNEEHPSDNQHMQELERFKLLVASISDYAIYMLDTEGRVVSWNSGAERFKGYRSHEIIGKNFSCFYTSEDQAKGLPAKALKIAEDEGRFEAQGWRVRQDGSQFWANAIIDPIRSDAGKLLGFAKITRDITAQRSAEEALRLSEQQFRMLVQGVTDYAIYMLDTTGCVTNWNSGAQRIKGYLQKEVLGTHFSRFYTEEDRANGVPDRALRTALIEGRFEQEGWRVRKDGTHFFAHVVIDPLYSDMGEFIGYAKITRDITEKQLAAAALKSSERALQQAQKMETIGKLTGGVAHDFNNLLQIISGNLQLLSIELAGNVSAERRLNAALAGVNRGAKLASYLLAFGRRQALDPKVVNIGRFVQGMGDILQRTLGESIEIETVVSGGLWNTLVDVVQVENALLNLSINARDAMNGNGKLTIEIGNAFLDDEYARTDVDVVAGQYVLLALTDTGTGMSDEVAAQAFEPFFSTKGEGKGTGLGLSMVYGFVKQSGGHVKIYSEVNVGTTIKIYLPRSQEIEDVATEISPQIAIGGTETILVAEDDEQLCITVVEMLRELGYQVLKVNDAAGALTIIESGIRIDLLFTDVVMPGPLRSPDLARKARERLPDLAVLFTSGYTQNAIVHGGRLDPGVELLSKPYTREALARKIRQVLNHQKQRRNVGSPVAYLSKELLQEPSLRILLVEADEQIRGNSAEMLEQLGHLVTQAANASLALHTLKTSPIDMVVTDVQLEEISAEELVSNARAINPALRVVYATSQHGPDNLEGAAVLRKPYNIVTLASALRAARK